MFNKTIYIFWLVLVDALAGSAMAWTGVDVGTPTPGGAAFDEATGTWTIDGNGHDIWDNSDNFHYVYKYLVGDGSISARVVVSASWAKTSSPVASGTVTSSNTNAS